MSIWVVLCRYLLVIGVAVSLPLSAQAFCGFYAGKADASLFNEASQVVLARDGQKTVISMLNDYKGSLREFVLVVPTPTVIKQGDVRVAERAVFSRLDAYSSPRLAEYFDPDPCPVHPPRFEFYPVAEMRVMNSPALHGPRNAHGVKVEAAFTLEEYDIVSLSATQSKGLELWLRQNGYRIPKGASAALKPYINQGMKFFAAKVNLKEQAKTGYTYLRPLQFGFESEKFMLPMRLGMLNASPGKPQDLIVYVLSRQGRVESSNYRTVKLPANVDVPFFIKPRFKEMYQALFDQAATREEMRVVFTEYFWDMGKCDPCVEEPLSVEEQRKAGAFWADGNWDGATSLTRLHLRYTPTSFPEDLMLTATQDHQNWQTRYVIRHPYAGGMPACQERVAKLGCTDFCRPQLDQLKNVDPKYLPKEFRERSPAEYLMVCVRQCEETKRTALESGKRYYEQDLPKRLAAEKETLAKITGWSLSAIDAMPGARDYAPGVAPLRVAPPAAKDGQ